MKKVLVLSAIYCLFSAPAFAQSVDILYAGETYAPPFYRGGALWSGESVIKLFAVPQGLGNPASLNYKWRRGTLVLGDLSGVGMNTISYTDSIFSKPQIFSVEIIAADDSTLANAFVNVVPLPPSLLIYERNPLYGFLFNREASSGYSLVGTETTFAAFPLFFSALSRIDPSLTYSWRSNAGEDGTESEVTYRIPESGAGQASISVKTANPTTIRQMAEKGFLVQFDNESRTE